MGMNLKNFILFEGKILDTIIEQLAQREYELFVVNTSAAGVQGKDGNYYTKYFPVTPFLLRNMISTKGSLGCYQQKYRTNRIRWICFDFDCKDKENPDIHELYRVCIRPLVDFLRRNEIHYLQEFSGRRGIHIWIIFDEMITKELGFSILNSILSEIPELEEAINNDKWGLDKFPASGVSSSNVVGKQVKFPLSWHQSGSRSYFFEQEFQTQYDIESEEFYCSQFMIMSKAKMENAEELCRKLRVQIPEQNQQLYVQYEISDGLLLSADEVISYLSETCVFKAIFDRMRKGQQQEIDWFVLLGTIGRLDSDGKILLAILERYPCFDEATTKENIRRHKEDYYPATFGYLYQMYNLKMESEIEPEETGYEFLLCRAGMDKPKRIEPEKIQIKNIKGRFDDLKTIISKEINYMKDNDEVISVEIMNSLLRVSDYELHRYDKILREISTGELPYERLKPAGYKTYIRQEEDKERLLVSLGRSDRIITTALMLKLCQEMGDEWKSYSYQISFASNRYLFRSWFSSWGRYIRQIKSYLEVPFMNQNYVCYIDLKQCYNHVDLLIVYRYLEKKLNGTAKRCFEYLAYYNDELMKKIQDGSRIGVPQGPAYARALAELYLDNIVEKACAGIEKSKYNIFRYVDDIVVFSQNQDVALQLYQTLITEFAKAGLPINQKKSHFPQKIEDMKQTFRERLLHRNQFNYDLVQNEYSGLLLEHERNVRINRYLAKNSFQIESLSYIYGNYSFDEAQYRCFYDYGKQIMSSRQGKGRGFRKFYTFVLEDQDLVQYALQNQWFQCVPVDSINFSNLISTMYYLINDHRLSNMVLDILFVYYLNEDFKFGLLSEEDRIVMDSIMIKYNR